MKLRSPEFEGIADSTQSAADSETFERAGIVGTLPYLSPEMAAGRWSDVSTASDIYGLGAILYTMLTGREPYRGEDLDETLALIVRGELTPPRAINSKVDRELEAICLRCLALDPADRYGSADALAYELRRRLEGRPTGPPSAVREAWFWAKRHPFRIAAAGFAFLLIWVLGLAAKVSEFRVENKGRAERLANQVESELRLIRGATKLLANDPRLRAELAASESREPPRREVVEDLLRKRIEGENLFGIAGENPLVNVFVIQPDGVLLADTLPGSISIGRNFRVRDYFQAFQGVGAARPRGEVYVARSFRSVKDGRYKIAVSTRIWSEGGDLLGILVANVPIGPRLIALDMSREPEAVVLGPLDRSDPSGDRPDPKPPWEYIAVLDPRYLGLAADQPLEDRRRSMIPDFEGDPRLRHVASDPWWGSLVDLHRVGDTHLIVETTRRAPWPLSWLPNSPREFAP